LNTIDLLTDAVAEKEYIEGTLSQFFDDTLSVIGFGAFYECSAIESINFQNVERIYESAFCNCHSLKHFSFPICRSVGSSAFYRCRIQSLQMPSCQIVDRNAFEECTHLGTIDLPECSRIGYSAFFNCSMLTTVSAIKWMGERAVNGDTNVFANCANLKEVCVGSLSGVPAGAFASNRALESFSTSTATVIFSSAFESDTRLNLISFPECTRIHTNAFRGCISLSSVIFPKASELYANVFSECINMKSAEFPNLNYISNSAFRGCVNLTAVTVGTERSSVCQMKSSDAFSGVSPNVSIFVPDSLVDSYKTATNWTYYSSRIAGVTQFSVALPYDFVSVFENGQYSGRNDVIFASFESSYITTGAFQACYNLRSVYFSQTSTVFKSAFFGCSNLTEVYFHNATTISGYAFAGCTKLSEVYMPIVSTIANGAFRSCLYLESIYFPDLSSCASTCFSDCTFLSVAVLPKLVAVYSGTFDSCWNLKRLIVGTELSGFCNLQTSDSFKNNINLSGIYVPDSLATAYQTSTNWAYYSSIIKGLSEFWGSNTTPVSVATIAFDYMKGYISADGTKFTYEDSENCRSDVYEVEKGHVYELKLGSVVGTRFRAVFLSENPVGLAEGELYGRPIAAISNPQANASKVFIAVTNGYVIVQKDNVGTSGLSSYLIDRGSI